MAESDIEHLQSHVLPDWRIIFGEAPAVGLMSLLDERGQGSLGNPFTQFLLTNLGRGNALHNLHALVTPSQGTGTGLTESGSIVNFSQDLLNSLFDPHAANPLGDYNIGSFADAGRAIYDLLTGTGTAGQSFAREQLEQMGFNEVAGYISSLIDTFGAFSMNELQRTLIKNGLMKLQSKYVTYLREAEQTGAAVVPFAQYLIQEGADWLFKWWKQSQVQGDATGSGSNTDQQ